MSPSSHGSRSSRTSFPINNAWHWTDLMACIFSLILLPSRLLLWMPFLVFRLLNIWGSKTSSDPGSSHLRNFHSFRNVHTTKDHVVNRSIDRRRGVVEVSTITCVLLPLEVFYFHCLSLSPLHHYFLLCIASFFPLFVHRFYLLIVM